MPRNRRFVLLGRALVFVVVAAVAIGSGGASNSTKSAGPSTIVVENAGPSVTAAMGMSP